VGADEPEDVDAAQREIDRRSIVFLEVDKKGGNKKLIAAMSDGRSLLFIVASKQTAKNKRKCLRCHSFAER
jgi:hypothetical protein